MNTLLAFSEIRFVAKTLPKHIYVMIGTYPTGSALHLHQYCHMWIPFSSFSNYITSLRMFFEVVDEILPISNHYDLQVLYGSNQHSLLRWKNFLYEKFVKTTDANHSFKDSSVFQFLYGFHLPSPSVSTIHQIQIASFVNFINKSRTVSRTNTFFRKYLIGGFNKWQKRISMYLSQFPSKANGQTEIIGSTSSYMENNGARIYECGMHNQL